MELQVAGLVLGRIRARMRRHGGAASRVVGDARRPEYSVNKLAKYKTALLCL